jgi:hypothetical protein
MNISFHLVLILRLSILSFFFLFLMTCLLLLILSQVLCIRDITHCLFLSLNHHLILLCIQPTNLLGFLGPWIGIVFLFLLFRLLLIILLYLSLIIKLLFKSVGIKLYKINFGLFKTIILGASSLV